MITVLPVEVEGLMHPKADRAITWRIIEYLERGGLGSTRDIAKNIKINEKTAKKHLGRLAKAGVVEEMRIGKARVFRIMQRS